MLKTKKQKDAEKPIVYYNIYEYTNSIQPFGESGRLSENELNTLECYSQYQIDWTLNSLDDKTLNDYLYKIFYSKKTRNNRIDASLDKLLHKTT